MRKILTEADKDDLIMRLRFYEGTHSLKHLIEWTEEKVLERVEEIKKEIKKIK